MGSTVSTIKPLSAAPRPMSNPSCAMPLILETKYGTKTYPLDELLHLYLAEGAQRTDILEHLKEEVL